MLIRSSYLGTKAKNAETTMMVDEHINHKQKNYSRLQQIAATVSSEKDTDSNYPELSLVGASILYYMCSNILSYLLKTHFILFYEIDYFPKNTKILSNKVDFKYDFHPYF